jgi:hypothetical protein
MDPRSMCPLAFCNAMEKGSCAWEEEEPHFTMG